jgi:hypothetical protein
MARQLTQWLWPIRDDLVRSINIEGALLAWDCCKACSGFHLTFNRQQLSVESKNNHDGANSDHCDYDHPFTHEFFSPRLKVLLGKDSESNNRTKKSRSTRSVNPLRTCESSGRADFAEGGNAKVLTSLPYLPS